MANTMRYSLTPAGRLHYLVLVAFVPSIMLLGIFSGVYSRYSSGRPLNIVEWIFISPIASVLALFSIYCLMRAFGKTDRLLVTDKSLTYRGIFRTFSIPWSSIKSIESIWDRAAGFKFVKISIASEGRKLSYLTLDLTGLTPNRLDFLRQAASLCPQAALSIQHR